MNNVNSWDKLSQFFDTHKRGEDIPAGAADNVLIAWPSIINIINTYVHTNTKVAIDLGCGTGSFTNKLSEMGYRVTGIDPSDDMIRVAIKNSKSTTKFIVGDSSLLASKKEQLDVVTAIMALQFIHNIEETVQNIAASLQNGGVTVIAVFNPLYVKTYLRKNELFEGFTDSENPTSGYINLEGQKIPTFVRTSDEYDKLFTIHGLTKVAQDEPPFTKEFLAKYPGESGINAPEYLILGYKKE